MVRIERDNSIEFPEGLQSERFVLLPFSKTLGKCFSKIKNTPVPKILAGLLTYIDCIGDLSAPKEKSGDEEFSRSLLEISEGTSHLLYFGPKEKGLVLPGIAGKILAAVKDSCEKVQPAALKALTNLAQGPDLDVSFDYGPADESEYPACFKSFNFSEVTSYLQAALDEENLLSSQPLTLTARELVIPVYDRPMATKKRASSRPVFEFKFKDNRDCLLLQLHLKRFPRYELGYFDSDCRLGFAQSEKQRVTAPLFFGSLITDSDEINLVVNDPRKIAKLDLTSSLRIGLAKPYLEQFALDRKDAIFFFHNGLFPDDAYAIRGVIGLLRLMALANLTLEDQEIVSGAYIFEESRKIAISLTNLLNERRTFLTRGLPEEAKTEILQQCFLNALLDSDLFLMMAKDLGLLALFKAGKISSGEERLKQIIGQLKGKPDPNKVVDQLNELADLFSFV